MNTTDHVFEETKIAGQSRCVAETLTIQGLLPKRLLNAYGGFNEVFKIRPIGTD